MTNTIDLVKLGILSKLLHEEDLSSQQKSNIVKQAHQGKDFGSPGKNFKKIANKAAKKYGSKEAGNRVAGAIFWNKMRHGG